MEPEPEIRYDRDMAKDDFTTQTNYQKAIDKNLVAAREPHYKFVQFLVLLCAGMLALSAPLQSGQNAPSHPAALLSLLAMVCLCGSVIAGAIALYGEKNGHDRIAKEMVRIRKKHEGNEILAGQEVVQQDWSRAPAIHRRAFHIQWPLALLAVVLLLLSKALLWFPPATNTPHPEPGAQAVASESIVGTGSECL